MSNKCTKGGRTWSQRYPWVRRPLFGAARISHAMAPRKGGVTKDAVISTRTRFRPGMFVRATSQAIGAATAAEINPTLVATIRLTLSGAAKVSSVTRRAMFAKVRAPSLSVSAYQASQASGKPTRAARKSPQAISTSPERSTRDDGPKRAGAAPGAARASADDIARRVALLGAEGLGV